MHQLSEFKVGQKVLYAPYKDCEGSEMQKGIVKEVPEPDSNAHPFYCNNIFIRVVFHCNEEWSRYMDYTSQLTPIDRLKIGWE